MKQQFRQNTATLTMEQNLENYGLEDANVKILNKNTENIRKSHKCNQCDYVSSHTGHLRAHLKKHSGEGSYKCNLCDFASSQAGDLRRHLKIHSGEKTNATNVTLHHFMQAL